MEEREDTYHTWEVLSGTDKKPKGGAMVSTHGISGYSTLTEEDGTFKLDLPVFASSIDVSSPDDHLVEVGLRSTEEQSLIFFISSDRGTVVR